MDKILSESACGYTTYTYFVSDSTGASVTGITVDQTTTIPTLQMAFTITTPTSYSMRWWA